MKHLADPNNITRRALNAQLALGDRFHGVFCDENPKANAWWQSYSEWIHKFRLAVEWEEANNPDGSLPTVRAIQEVTCQMEDAAGLLDEEKAAFERFQREQQDKEAD
nr:hypothetical protein [uncultured Mediterranean phage uvMED]